jgi:ABC-type antimicrobial peptide transport system permease subunit
MLGELKNAIDEGEDSGVFKKEEISKIINIVISLETQVKSYNLEDRDELLGVLEEFRKFLTGLDVSDEEIVDDVDSKEEENNVDDLFKNLELLKELLKLIQGGVPSTQTPQTSGSDEVGKGAGFKEDELKNPNLVVYKNVDGKIKPGIVSKTQIAKPGNISLETPKFEASSFAKSKKDILNVVPFVKKGDKITFTYKGKKIVGTISKISKDNDVVVVKDDQGKTFNLTMRNTDFKKVESLIFEEVNPNPGDEKSKKVLEKLKGAANILTSSKDKGLAIDIKWIDQILSLRNDEKVQELVKGLYKTVYAYLLGDKRQTLNPNTSKLMEGFIDDYKLDTKYGYGVGKTQIAAEKMARFYFFCLKFTSDNPLDLSNGDIGAYKLIGNIGNKLKELNESTTGIMKRGFKKEEKTQYKVGDLVKYKRDNGEESQNEITKIEGDKIFFKDKDDKEFSKNVGDIISKVETKNETLIKNYNQFRKVFEAKEIEHNLVESKFEELFTEDIQKKFYIPDGEIGKINEIGKESDTFILKDADPIIEIVRLFQRAWRLHTVPTIPSGRTGGKVSMSVYLEYEYMGTSSPGEAEKPGYGPWRNIELFEKWNDAVFNILKDTKYTTTIFSDDAKFYWNYDKRFKEAKINGDIFKNYKEDDIEDQAKPLGKILLRFINNLTNDSSMYSKEGNLQKFLQEYFGLEGEQLKKLGGLSYPSTGDVKANSATAGDMATPVSCKWEKIDSIEMLKNQGDIRKSIFSKPEDLKKLIFKAKNKDEKMEYFYYIETKNNKDAYFLRMDTFFFDQKNLRQSDRMQQPKKIELIKMDITRTTNVITTRSMKFDGYIGVVFDNKKTFEQLVLRDYKDVKVLESLKYTAAIIAFVSLFSSILYNLSDKLRIFGVIRSIGSTQTQLNKIVFAENLFLTSFGTAMGIISSFLLNPIIIHVINKSAFGWTLSIEIPYLLVFFCLLSVPFVSFLATLYPFFLLKKLSLREILSYE